MNKRALWYIRIEKTKASLGEGIWVVNIEFCLLLFSANA